MSWVFSYVFVMTGGGPGQSTQVTETYIYCKRLHVRSAVARGVGCGNPR